MAVTRSSLIAGHPEFTDASTALVEWAIAQAEARIDETVLGDSYDQAVEWQACELLSHSPFGIQMRLVADPTKSIYRGPLDELLKAAGTAYRYVP